jgi:hypothetical protein
MTKAETSLSLATCEDADMPRFFEIMSLGFGREHEYINIVFPEHDTPAGRALGGERMLQAKKDPITTCLKVTDNNTGEIIGIAKWNLYKNEVPEETGLGTTEYWDTAEMAEYAEDLYVEYLKNRRAAIRASKGNLVGTLSKNL